MGMFIKIKVFTKSSQNKIGEKTGEFIKVYVTDAPEKGKANKRLISLISEWLEVPKSKITIISGLHSQKKIIEIK